MHIEKGRLGQFFLFIGLILLILFAGSSQTQGTQVGYFCLSMLVFAVAFFLIFKDWKPPSAGSRFSSLRKITQRKGGKGQAGKN
jgi:hypothetical protein